MTPVNGKSFIVAIFTVMALFLSTQAQAVVITIDFDSDPPGAQPNGFVSDDSALISFTDTVGSGLSILNPLIEGNGTQGLAVFTDFDDSQLLMNFAVNVNTVGLDFGNDDPGFSNPGDLAVMTAFLGVVQVGQVTVVMNRDDLMNQSISLFGFGSFDSATFKYAVNPTQGLIEFVDNVTFNTVPEPATLLLLGTGLGAVAYRRRRKS